VDIKHLKLAKDGVVLANSGHFNVEINVEALEKISSSKRRVKEYIDEYKTYDGKRIYLLAEGRVLNLVAAEGHPAIVMDMSFANQALGAEYIAKNAQNLEKKIYVLPENIDKEIAELKLSSMGIEIDSLTKEQQEYLSSWRSGT